MALHASTSGSASRRRAVLAAAAAFVVSVVLATSPIRGDAAPGATPAPTGSASSSPSSPQTSPQTGGGSAPDPVAAPAPSGTKPALPPVVKDASSAPTEGEAAAIAAKFDHEVKVDSATTSTVEVVAQPSGSLRMRQSLLPKRVQRDGKWLPLDLSLAKAANGTIAPKAAAVPVEFSPGGAGPLFRVQGADGSWVTTLWDVPLPAPKLSGASATYASVFPGVDLLLTATAQGMAQVLVISTPEAAADPRVAALLLRTEGAAPAEDRKSGLLVSADKSLVATPATWWDSKNGGSATGPGWTGIPRPLDTQPSSEGVILDVAAAAKAEGAVFPIYVDPPWTGYVQGRTFTDSAYPNQPYWNGAGASDGWQHVGYINAANSDDGRAHTTRSYWQMDSSALAGTHVSSAYFNTSIQYSSSCNARGIELWSTDVVSPSTTWNTNPGLSSYQDGHVTAAGYSGSCPAAAIGFNVTQAAQAAAAAPYGSLYFGAKATDEGDWLTWKKLSPDATLDVDFTRPPGAPLINNGTCSRYPGLVQGDVLRGGDVRWSQAATFFLMMQTDGNLVMYQPAVVGSITPATPLWSSATSGNPGAWAVLQGDGNLVVYSAAGPFLWANYGGAKYVVVQNDGNLVSYTAGGAPSWWSGSPYGYPGANAVCYTNADWTHLESIANDNNGGVLLRYWVEVYYGVVPAAAMWDNLTLPGVIGAWNVLWPADGGYSFRVRACATATDTALVCGGYSHWWGTVIDRVAPAAPVVTPIAGDTSFLASMFSGTVGRSDATVRIAPVDPLADNLAGYMYRVMPTASDGTLSSATGVFPANPHCGTSEQDYTTVCRSRVDQSFDVVLAALDERTQLSVLAFDMAGNSTSVSGMNTVQLNSKPDTAAVLAGHSWTTDVQPGSSPTCAATAVTDNAPASPKSLTLSASACRSPAIGPGLPTDPGVTLSALKLNGTSASVAKTASSVIDTSRSFTIGAWLNPAVNVPAGTAMPALAQDGSNTSAFMLQDGEGYWRFCAAPADTSSWAGGCVSSVNKAALNTWTFVVGVFDALNHQLRLYVSSDGATYTPTVQAFEKVTASTGPFYVGRDKVGTNYRYWNGQVADPFAFQGVISVTTFEYLGQMMMATNTIPAAP